jgi:hypothetical protein
MKAYRESEGWTLYYSEEGFPYYFNSITSASEWATQDSYFESWEDEKQRIAFNKSKNAHQYVGHLYENYEMHGKNEEDDADEFAEDDENEDEEEDEDDEDSIEEDEESGGSSLDETLEKKFKEFLRTPEGIEAMLVR